MKQVIGFDLEVQAYHYEDMRKLWNAALEAAGEAAYKELLSPAGMYARESILKLKEE